MDSVAMWLNLPVAAVAITVMLIFLRTQRDRDATHQATVLAILAAQKDTLDRRDAVIANIAGDFAETSRAHTLETKELAAVMGGLAEVIRKCPGPA